MKCWVVLVGLFILLCSMIALIVFSDDTVPVLLLKRKSSPSPKDSYSKQNFEIKAQSTFLHVLNTTKNIEKLEEEWDFLNTRGLWVLADENYYMGEKDSQNFRHGLGAIALPNGDYYVGQWRRNVRHGYGKTLTGYSFGETEEVYMCDWRFDEPHGHCWYYTGEGHNYIGSFLCGRQEGFGIFSWMKQKEKGEGGRTFGLDNTQKAGIADNLELFVSGDSLGEFLVARYVGEWRNGKQHGYGFYETDTFVHEGKWEEGRRTGLAKITYKDTGKVIYKQFADDTPVP